MALILAAQLIWAVDETYYSSLNNKKDEALRTAITSLVYTHHTTALGYNWNFADMDIVNHEVLDMYSTCSWSESTDQCGTYSGVCGCYNREHTVPQSLFSSQSPQVGDRHHLFLTDGKVNAVRSNYAFGETNETTTWNDIPNGSNALGQLGKASYAYASSVTVYEPDDEYKGDIARAIMYMAVRYATNNECRAYNGSGNEYPVTAWSSNAMFSGSLSTNYGLSDAAVQTFLKWHREDKVSAKEIARNTGVENAQGNRNPFVDYPILAEYLWGKDAGETFLLANAVGSFDEAFVPGVSDGSKDSGVEPLDPDYYAPVTGLSDSLLKSKLAELTWSHYTKRYSYGSGKNNTWDAFWYTDRNEADNSVVDMYSNNKRYFNPDNTTASVAECDIEHMFPNSWFGGESGNKHAYCDLHHLVPADYSANRSKSNRGPGVPTDTTFNNGVWVNGKDGGRDNLEVFCPPDEYKGDFARAFFYIATTYGDTAVWQKEAVPNHMSNSDWHEFLPLTRDLLLEWHRQDPVSEKERVRMNIVYGLQGNRNPFIDYPCLAEYIWGVHQSEPFNLDCSESPVPPTKYTITWNVDGEESSSEVTKGLRPSAPSVEDCSASRVLAGWTTSSSVSEKPEILYSPATIPAATKPVTYYAVYADKETEEDGGDFTFYSGELTEGDYVIYYNGKAMKAAASDNRLSYETVTPADNKISTEDASIIWHIAYTDGYWRIYNAGEEMYAASTGTKNQARLLADESDDCSQWTVSGTTAYEFVNKKNAAASVNANLRNNSTYGFACYSTSTGGALSLYKQSGKVSYSNYSLSCSAAEKYTVEFWNGEELHDEITGQEGEGILVYDPTPACEQYTFSGWSEAICSTHSTEKPELVVPTVIPGEDKTYYAVFSKTVEAGIGLTNRYRMITTASELTNANYLVVADTSKLLAMSTDWKNTYYLNSVEVAENEGVITTENGKIVWAIQLAGSVLNFYNSASGYLYIEQSVKNEKTYYNIKLGENTETNGFTFTVEDGVWGFSSVSYPDRQLEYYRKNGYWAYYTSQGAPVYLYKQQEGTVYATYYTTSPDCSGELPTDFEPARGTKAARKVLKDNRLYIVIGDQVYDGIGKRVR